MDLDFSSVRPSVVNWLIVGLLSVTFIVFFKFVFNKWQVPGVSELFNAA